MQKKFVPVMLTPFDKDGTIDYSVLTKLTEYYIESGATGLFANCLSSEMFELSDEERIAITQHVINVADRAVPVFSTGTFETGIEEQTAFIKRIYETGASAVIAINSVLATADHPDEWLNEQVFRLLEKTGDIPMGFYECPVPYKRTFNAGQLKSIAATGRIVYYKDTSLSTDIIREKLDATKQSAGFELYEAHMSNAVASLKAGCAGLSCIQGNFSPELVSWLAKNYNDPALQEEVEKVQQYFTGTMEVMHDVYPIAAKYFLRQKGIPVTLYTRRKVGVFSYEKRTAVDNLLNETGRLLSALGISNKVVA